MIYLDNAATSLQKPKEVEEAVIRAFHTMGNPGRGAHEATLQAGRCVYQVREQLAELFHAEKGERIAFTSNATVSLVELNKSRKEVDNISAAVIRTCREG